MEKWLFWRGLRLVPAEFVSIEGYAPPALPPTHVLPPGLYDLDVDKNVPHLLERRFNNTVNVRVAQKDNGKQLFIIVRNLTQVKFAKKDLFTLCKDFVQFADTIFFSSRLPPQSNQTCLAQAAQYRRSLEMLLLSDIRYKKLQNKLVPRYVLLNEADVVAREKRYKRTRMTGNKTTRKP